MAEFEGTADRLVGDVDCTAAGKPLCDSNGVQGFRDFDALKKFADENLGPSCGPSNLDLCDDDQKKTIEKYLALSADDLDAAIKEAEKGLADAEESFKNDVEQLQKAYEGLMKTKDDAIAAIKAGGLGMMKSVKAAAGGEKKEEL